MQKVDPAFLFETGDTARGIGRLTENMDRLETWIALHATQSVINNFIYQSVYSEHFHSPLFVCASGLLQSIGNLMTKLFPEEGEGQALSAWEIQPVQREYAKFETILISELQSISSYIVTRKGGFDVAAMVDAGRVFFSRDLTVKVPDALPDLANIKRFSDVVIISDFAEEPEDVLKMLQPLFARGIRGHLVEVIDPVEEDFPYAGRKDFYDPETETRISAGRAQTVANEYRAEFLARRELLKSAAKQQGWSYTVSRTDASVTAALLTLHNAFSAAGVSGNEAKL